MSDESTALIPTSGGPHPPPAASESRLADIAFGLLQDSMPKSARDVRDAAAELARLRELLAKTESALIQCLEQRDDLLCQSKIFACAARAVIAAGRPDSNYVGMNEEIPCNCAKCAAYDALKALLEKS